MIKQNIESLFHIGTMFSVLLWYVRLYSLKHIGQRIVNWQRVFRNMGSIPLDVLIGLATLALLLAVAQF